MKTRHRNRKRAAVRAEIEHVTGDLEPITDHELRIIKLALQDRYKLHAGTDTDPAAEAAMSVLGKIIRNEDRAAQAARA